MTVSSTSVAYFEQTIDQYIQNPEDTADKHLELGHLLVTHTKLACDKTEEARMASLREKVRKTKLEDEDTKALRSLLRSCVRQHEIPGRKVAWWVNAYQIPVIQLELDLAELAEFGELLEYLDFSECEESSEAISHLISSCPNLKTLIVANCTNLTALPKLPNSLKTLLITDCPKLETVGTAPQTLEKFLIADCAKLSNHFIEALPGENLLA